MDKAVILGAFEFIGFHMCKKMLDDGYEVKGIHVEKVQSQDEAKRLEVGRNANFQEQSIEEWLESKREGSTEKQTIIISLFDLFMGHKENRLTSSVGLIDYLNERKKWENTVVLLLPIQLAVQQEALSSLEQVNHFLEKIADDSETLQFVYLPTVYGPWQPSTYAFQKAIEGNMVSIEEVDEREWTKDAIFIDDLLQKMMEIVEGEEAGHFLLESGEPERWKECADFLHFQHHQRENLETPELTFKSHINRISINKLTPVAESIALQKQHINHFKDKIRTKE